LQKPLFHTIKNTKKSVVLALLRHFWAFFIKNIAIKRPIWIISDILNILKKAGKALLSPLLV
jgi:hypothetical protein